MTTLGVTSPFYGGGQVPNPSNVISTVGAPSSAITAANGTIAVDNAAAAAYMAVSQVGGVVTWDPIVGGSSVLASLHDAGAGVATPSAGAIILAGTANQITTTAASHTVTFTIPSTFIAPGTVTSTGLLTGSAGISTSGGATTINSGTSVTSISTDAAATTVNIATGNAAKALTLGSTNASASTLLQGGNASIELSSAAGGIVITPNAGDISMVPGTTSVASPTAGATLNDRFACVTFTGFTTAAAASQNFTITNNEITATSAILCTVTNLNASTNGAVMTLVGLTQAANSLIVHTTNNGGGALGAGDNVLINFWILS